jgi:hypothetical protein
MLRWDGMDSPKSAPGLMWGVWPDLLDEHDNGREDNL